MPQLQSLLLQTGLLTDEKFVDFVGLDHLPKLSDLTVTGSAGVFYDECDATRLFCGVSASIQSVSLSRVGDLGIIKHFGPSLVQLNITCCGFDMFDSSIYIPELRNLTVTTMDHYRDA